MIRIGPICLVFNISLNELIYYQNYSVNNEDNTKFLYNNNHYNNEQDTNKFFIDSNYKSNYMNYYNEEHYP